MGPGPYNILHYVQLQNQKFFLSFKDDSFICDA